MFGRFDRDPFEAGSVLLTLNFNPPQWGFDPLLENYVHPLGPSITDLGPSTPAKNIMAICGPFCAFTMEFHFKGTCSSILNQRNASLDSI